MTDTPPRVLKPRSLLVHWFIEYNPFYLLSAACMLGSCLALTNSLSWDPIPLPRLLTLMVTLNLYEAAVLAIALFLITRRGLQRDGRMLLILQAFFLVDFAYLNAEIATAGMWLGIVANAIMLLLAIVKLGVVIRVLRPNFTPMQLLFVLVQLVLLFAVPCVLFWMETCRMKVGPRQFYVLWWIVGMIPALYELMMRFDPGRNATRSVISGTRPGDAAPVKSWLALPFVSFLTHLGILHYVYGVTYYGAHAAPVLLGLTLVLNRFSPSSLIPRKDLFALRLILPAAAILVSANNPFTFPLNLPYPKFIFTPLNLTLAAAFVIYVYMFLAVYWRVCMASGAAIAAAYIFGPSRAAVELWAKSGWSHTVRVGEKLTPRTLYDWGVIGLVASFLLLGVGFWVSLKKRPPHPDEESTPTSPPRDTDDCLAAEAVGAGSDQDTTDPRVP